MDSNDNYPVHIGTWTNWSRGAVMGSTLTIRRDVGNLLIAFVAFFVAWVGTRFWRIACLILHYVYSSRDARDGLHHQRQALLRNSSNPESAIGTILFLLHSWRGSGVAGAWAPLVRLLVVLALAALSVGGFAVASGFSSQISVGISDEVLISGANCMNINQTAFFALNTTELGIYFKPFLNRQREGAAAYAKQCYKPDAPGALGCGTFVRTKVSSEVRTDAPCPFDDSLCKLKNGNLIIDTGLLDSHGDLGINAPAGERLQFRRRMHCGPLVTEGFKTIRNTTQGRSFTRYHYGRTLSFDLESSVNFTFEVSNDWLADLKDEEGGRDSGDFELGVKQAFAYNGSIEGTSTLKPIPALWDPSADLYLIFLGPGTVLFSGGTDDPWYNATMPVARDITTDMNATLYQGELLYRPAEPASPMACKVQEQFCNPNYPGGPRCTALLSTVDAQEQAQLVLWADDVPGQTRLGWLWLAAFGTYGLVPDILKSLGTHALNSRDSLSDGVQGKLPNDQWTRDMKQFHDVSLACMQWSMLMTATGPSDPRVEQWYVKPVDQEETKLCNSQKIRSTAYASFSVFGIAFIFSVGGLIILISYGLDPLMSTLRRRLKVKEYQQLEWRTNAFLQLQRLAHEELGVGTWSRTAEHVPVTKPGEWLGLLDVSEPEHPVLVRPPPKPEAVDVVSPAAQNGREKGNVRIETVGPAGTSDGGSHSEGSPTTAFDAADDVTIAMSPVSGHSLGLSRSAATDHPASPTSTAAPTSPTSPETSGNSSPTSVTRADR